jgi:hypothetical protein
MYPRLQWEVVCSVVLKYMVQPRYIVLVWALVLKNIPVGYDLRWQYQPEPGTCLGPEVLPWLIPLPMPGVPYTRQRSALNVIPIKFLKIPNTRFISALVSRFEHTRLVLVHNSSCVQNLELVTWVQIQRVVFWKNGNFDAEIDVQSGWLRLFETTPLSDCQGAT